MSKPLRDRAQQTTKRTHGLCRGVRFVRNSLLTKTTSHHVLWWQVITIFSIFALGFTVKTHFTTKITTWKLTDNDPGAAAFALTPREKLRDWAVNRLYPCSVTEPRADTWESGTTLTIRGGKEKLVCDVSEPWLWPLERLQMLPIIQPNWEICNKVEQM